MSLMNNNDRQASLPSRGAWIEMMKRPLRSRCSRVAPLTGSVDRNRTSTPCPTWQSPSLPSRGAWIEIAYIVVSRSCNDVAPLTGSVDRNPTGKWSDWRYIGRSPHGERG